LPLSILAALTDPSRTLKPVETPADHVDPDDPFEVPAPRSPEPFVWLIVAAAPGSEPPQGTAIQVRGGCFLIGHGEGCQLRVSGRFVGRRHAAIERCGDRVLVTDLGSETGSSVNGRPLVNSTAVLSHGDRVRFGPLACTVAIGADLARPPKLEDMVTSWVGGNGSEPHDAPTDDVSASRVPEEFLSGHRVSFEVIEGVLVITPKLNRLDNEADAERFRQGLAEVFELGISDKVVIKLNHVTHVSSQGLGVLLAFFLRLTRSGGALRICEIHSRVHSVLEQFRLPVLLQVCPTVEEAVLSGWD
jgi:anti-anti-sigma factor